MGDVCCFFFFVLVKRGQTDRRMNTEQMCREMILNHSHLLLCTKT